MLYFKQFLHSQSSEWVVFIHGAGGSSAVWHKQLRDFQKDFNLLLIDLRGHGKSEEMPEAIWKQHYTFEAVTKDILVVLVQ
jgi:pimeloyl-ACP methyl ester carboxylesterase